jgi:DNA mismatch repair ATPase MutS
LLLLDEMLRGTNSYDKRLGSIATIESIFKNRLNGVIATNDLSIADYEYKNNQKIKNFHFDISIANKKMFFEYKLKLGVCRSTNASILLSEIGKVKAICDLNCVSNR